MPSWIRIRIRNLNADPNPDPATQINADPCGCGSMRIRIRNPDMYSTLLPLLLIGRFHAGLSHSGDPTITSSQQKAMLCPDQHHQCCCCCHHRPRISLAQSASRTTIVTHRRHGSATLTRPLPPAGSQGQSQNFAGHCGSFRSR